jgi:hypothetical protein
MVASAAFAFPIVKSVLYGIFVWTHGVPNSQKTGGFRCPARGSDTMEQVDAEGRALGFGGFRLPPHQQVLLRKPTVVLPEV